MASIPGLDVPSATQLLGLVWLPVIPLGAYFLARQLSGRRDVALVAAVLTAFAGGFDLSNDRLWVDSMFLVGHVAYPIYPRDLVFGILPFAAIAFLRATDAAPRWLGWSLVSGGLLGLCALIQIQLLIPIPLAFAVLAGARAWRDRGRWTRILAALLTTGLVALAVVGPWLVYIAGVIRSNGGVAIDSSDDLLPVRIGFWDYPIQFGLILPLAIVGAGVVLLFLRRADGPHPGGNARPLDPASTRRRAPPAAVVDPAIRAGRPLPAELALGGRAPTAADVADLEPARRSSSRRSGWSRWPRPSPPRLGHGSGGRARSRSPSSSSPRCR